MRGCKSYKVEFKKNSAECHIWSEGLFGLSSGTLDTLVDKLAEFDFSILALTGDDLVTSRGREFSSPRDNVLLELGLFIGGIGKERTFIVTDKSFQVKLPTDLAGITLATFEPPNKSNLQSAVGDACFQIENEIKKLSIRQRSTVKKLDLNNCRKIITIYILENDFTRVSFERLEQMSSLLKREILEKLVHTFPDAFRISIAKGKPGLAIIRTKKDYYNKFTVLQGRYEKTSGKVFSIVS
ncbi:MAG: TIR domain-containing protein [Segetibacter sp.]